MKTQKINKILNFLLFCINQYAINLQQHATEISNIV